MPIYFRMMLLGNTFVLFLFIHIQPINLLDHFLRNVFWFIMLQVHAAVIFLQRRLSPDHSLMCSRHYSQIKSQILFLGAVVSSLMLLISV